jgi:hypothetical protein
MPYATHLFPAELWSAGSPPAVLSSCLGFSGKMQAEALVSAADRATGARGSGRRPSSPGKRVESRLTSGMPGCSSPHSLVLNATAPSGGARPTPPLPPPPVYVRSFRGTSSREQASRAPWRRGESHGTAQQRLPAEDVGADAGKEGGAPSGEELLRHGRGAGTTSMRDDPAPRGLLSQC